MKPDPTSRMKARIETFKAEVRRADQKGIAILPSVDGPYAYDHATGRVIGRKGSDGYQKAIK